MHVLICEGDRVLLCLHDHFGSEDRREETRDVQDHLAIMILKIIATKRTCDYIGGLS